MLNASEQTGFMPSKWGVRITRMLRVGGNLSFPIRTSPYLQFRAGEIRWRWRPSSDVPDGGLLKTDCHLFGYHGGIPSNYELASATMGLIYLQVPGAWAFFESSLLRKGTWVRFIRIGPRFF